MIVRLFCIAVASLAVAGCSTQARVDVYSQPDGAYIYHKASGKSFGVTPVTVAYESSSMVRRSDGCFYLSGLEAKWVSGATSTLETLKLCGAANGDYNITFSRSPDYPGLERDMEFALKVKSANAEQRKARAAEEAATAATAAANAAAYEAFKPAKPVTCKSVLVGNTVQMNCK